MILKKATVTTVMLGPFLDKTDGVTEEVGLAGTMTVYRRRSGSSFAARTSATAITHDATLNGWYAVELDATDTANSGPLTVAVQDAATHLPVWHEFQVVDGLIYDAIYSNVTTNLAFNANGRVDVGEWLGTAVGAATAGTPDVNLVQWRGSTPNVLTSAMVDANTRQWAGTAVSAATAGVPDVNTTAINNDTTSAANLALSALGIVSGSFVGTPTTTVQDTDLTNANDDFYAPDPLLIITSGIGAGQRVGITGYNGTTKELTTDPLTVAPAAGDTFVIV